MMVGRLTEIDEDGGVAVTTFDVRADCFFVHRDGLLSEFGLIEHMAQSASAYAGLVALESGSGSPPVGLIGEVKRFKCYRRPAVGEKLLTKVVVGIEVAGVTALTCETRVGNELVAETRMKISIVGDNR